VVAACSDGVGDTVETKSAKVQRSASVQRTSERVGSMKNLAQTVKVSVTPEVAQKIRSQPVPGAHRQPVGVERV
jgi:stress response protein YsnF